jgi:hypothetical protein
MAGWGVGPYIHAQAIGCQTWALSIGQGMPGSAYAWLVGHMWPEWLTSPSRGKGGG